MAALTIERWDGVRMLVTGGAGFIGANFVHRTLREHARYEDSVEAAYSARGQ